MTMDPVRILLFVVVSLLTGLLIAVGIQAFLIFLDLKRSIKKLNQLLEDAQVLTNSVARPVQGLTHLVEGVKNIRSVIDFASTLMNKQQTVEPREHNSQKESWESSTSMEDEETQFRQRAALLLGEDAPHPVQKVQEHGRRFFHRAGKPLTS
ncbi:MAG: hypothetical protein HYW33_03565 [Candidatus Blackburnbacteria bacterium]|nr:hypothetical protein [Candidatus Blackburnbacteria bacterium]